MIYARILTVFAIICTPHNAKRILTVLAIISGVHCVLFALNVLAWTWLGDNAPIPIGRSLLAVLFWLIATALFALPLWLFGDAHGLDTTEENE